MLRLLIIIALVLALGFGISYLHSYPNSYLLLALGTITIETTLGVALGLVLLVIGVVWVVWSFGSSLFALPGKALHQWDQWQSHNRQATLQKVIRKLNAGEHTHYQALLRKLTNAELGLFERTAIIAREKLESANPAQADATISELEALATNGQQREHCMRLRAEFWLKTGAYTQLAELDLPLRLAQQNFWREAIATAALETNNWERLYLQLKKQTTLPRKFWLHALESEDSKLVHKVWVAAPSSLKNQLQVATTYLQKLLADKRFEEARILLVDAAKKPALFPLLAALGTFEVKRPEKLLSQMEHSYAEMSHTLPVENLGYFALGLGKLCLQLKLSGKAEDYLRPLVRHPNYKVARQVNLALACMLADNKDYALAMEHIKAIESNTNTLRLTPQHADSSND